MTRRMLAVATFVAALLSWGCYVSLHPLVSKDVLVFEPALIGTWLEENASDKDRWVFKPAGQENPQEYLLEITEHGVGLGSKKAEPVRAVFSATLARFGDVLVLQVFPDYDESLGPLHGHGTLKMTLVPAYMFFRVRLNGDSLRMTAIDNEWLDQAITAKTVRIPHEHLDADPNPHENGRADLHPQKKHGPEGEDWILMTAPTSQLQALVRRHAKSGLFDEQEPGEFVRQK